MDAPRVSVSLIAYNHAPFIAQAIEGVLNQRTTFPFEIVIGEDESSDGTREIVQRYAAAHPDKIRLNLHSRGENLSYQGRPTGQRNYAFNIRSVRGEYVALLDGDDYWTDPEKLQRQVDYLDAHPECTTCFHRVDFVDEHGADLPSPSQVTVLKPTYTLHDLLRGVFFNRTASVLFRRDPHSDLPDWYYRCPVADFPLHALNGMRGDFGFLDRAMAKYRIHAGGYWSAAGQPSSPAEQQVADERRLRQLEGTVHLYEILAEELPAEYLPATKEALARYRYQMAHLLRRLGRSQELRLVAAMLWRSALLPADIGRPEILLLWIEGSFPALRRFTGAGLGLLAKWRAHA
jgi:glycosyltransferase involved in cell wall biosynthesis